MSIAQHQFKGSYYRHNVIIKTFLRILNFSVVLICGNECTPPQSRRDKLVIFDILNPGGQWYHMINDETIWQEYFQVNMWSVEDLRIWPWLSSETGLYNIKDIATCINYLPIRVLKIRIISTGKALSKRVK